MMRKVTATVRAKIAQWEGLRIAAYQDDAGVWTIGYGHTAGVARGDTCTQAQADAWLTRDLSIAESEVSRLVKVSLTDNQFGALVSFVFNVGLTAFAGSTLLKLLNAGNYAAVPGQLARWNKVTVAGKKVANRGLGNRRAAEAGLWASGEFVASQGVMPLAPQAASRSKTAIGAGLSSAGAAGAALTDTANQVSFVASYGTALTVLFVVITLAGVGLTLWDRLSIRRETGE